MDLVTYEEPKNPLTGESPRHQKSSSVFPKPVFLMKKTIISINEKIKNRAIIIDVYINKDYSFDIDSYDINDIYAKEFYNIDNIDKKVFYVRRKVPPKAIEGLDYLVVWAHKYYSETKDILLTASYYLKNIIILQALEDANHRTAIVATKYFLDKNGYTTKIFLDENDVEVEDVDAYGYKCNDDTSYWDLEDSRGYSKKVLAKYPESNKIIDNESFLTFKTDLIKLRDARYTNASEIELNPNDNTIRNPVFEYCLNFIMNKLLIE